MHPDALTVAARDNAADWLVHCADMLGAEASGLLTLQPDGGYSLISDGLDEQVIAEYREHYHRVAPLRALLDDRPAGRALAIDTTSHPAYLAQPEMSADYLRRHRIDHLLAAQWRQPDGSLRIIGLQRFHGSAPFTAAPLQGKPGLALLRLTPVHQFGRGIHGRLQRLFGLTPAEAEMTALLAQGRSLEAIAAARGVRVDTVRAQLRTVFRKTGMHRQGELASAVGRLAA